MRQRAFFVWSIAAFLFSCGFVLIVLAPLAEANNCRAFQIRFINFSVFFVIKIRRARTFGEHAFAVCSRCSAFISAYFCGFSDLSFLRSIEETEPLPRFWLFAAMIPMAIDWLLGVFRDLGKHAFSRF
jgi:uncharacterized membrane protein